MSAPQAAAHPGVSVAGTLVLENPGTALVLEPEPLAYGHGGFVRLHAADKKARLVFNVGKPVGWARFTCCHRYEPFWMQPAAGTFAKEIPVETQYLLAERADGLCVLLVPLIDAPLRCSLQGHADGWINLVAESGDPYTQGQSVLGLFIAVGHDPYALLEAAAPVVIQKLGTGKLRRDKPLPAFADQFGWCTWDAFYQDVSHEKVREGLQSFKNGGVSPKYLILDDGWQSVAKSATGENRLSAFAANSKFPGDLAPTVAMTKKEFGVETFMVWHAFGGYWGGVDQRTLNNYGVVDQPRVYSQGILHYKPDIAEWWGPLAGLVPVSGVHRFYQDYHRHLRLQGVDGVKVDNQASIEGLGQGQGGRVALMKAYREALEGSAAVNFNGTVINCMSCANEMIYGTLATTLTRTSTDFWPNKPESHGLHLYCNAQVSAWFGEFVHPDWDMFQSGHLMGPYHAAGRAVGGCPVYVSDKPNAHNFVVLRKLVLRNGKVLRSSQPGRPTRDCLFRDPTKEDVLLKIFTRVGDSALLGVFNARYHKKDAELKALSGTVSPADIPGLSGDDFVIYAHNAKTLHRVSRGQNVPVTLAELACEVFVIVPVVDGLALIGNTSKFNSPGTLQMRSLDAQAVQLSVLDGGRFVVWSARAPKHAQINGVDQAARYNPVTGEVSLDLPDQDLNQVLLKF